MQLEDSWTVNIIVVATTLLGMLYFYLTSTYNYWEKRGIPYVKPIFCFGNMKDQLLLKKPAFVVLKDIYKKLKGERFGGFFLMRTPVVMIKDPELIQRIFIKDFSYFQDRNPALGIDLKTNPLFRHLFHLTGQSWRNLRYALTPIFTTANLRGMVEEIEKCSNGVLQEIGKISDKNEAVNAKVLFSSYFDDLSASIAFGLQFQPESPKQVEFRKFAQYLTAPSFSQCIRLLVVLFFGRLTKLLKIRYYPKKVTNYYFNLVKSNMDYRKKNNIQRNDFLQLLINLKEQVNSGKRINWMAEISDDDAYLSQMDYSTEDNKFMLADDYIVAQAFFFLVGTSEGLSSSVQYTLYELAINPDVQSRLQQEIDTVLDKHGGKLTYESLKEMQYLDLVIQERNRKYTGVLLRTCAAPYAIPGTDFVLEKGTVVYIPLFAIHNDPEYYPDPEKFIPERFEGNNYRASGKYLPFGDGPRMCIAMRFVLLILKATLAKIMSQYSVTLDPRTKVPIEYDPKSPVLFVPKGGIWVDFKSRK